MSPICRNRLFVTAVIATLGGAALIASRHVMAERSVTVEEKMKEIRQRVLPDLRQAATDQKLAVGQPIFIRIFKEEKELELWMRPSAASPWKLFKSWKIATWGAGKLGPKLKEGDGQAPEGFYSVGAKQMNPRSKYHLSFNVGYPNAFDKAHGRTGSHIMVHGAEVSVGCFAMTDPVIEWIYLLAEAALANGQEAFEVHSFPFRMTAERLEKAAKDANAQFWQQLKPAYDAFEKHKLIPKVKVTGKNYQVTEVKPPS